MLVYGDSQFEQTLPGLLTRLKERIHAAYGQDLYELRALLIQAGQLEQALEDHWDTADGKIADPSFRAERMWVRKITDLAARAFYAGWGGEGVVNPESRDKLQEHLESVDRQLTHPLPAGSGCVSQAKFTVKVPEGFEFYALFPEQYCISAQRWLAEHRATRPKRAVVIGIRSIGTTLSSLVATVLNRADWQTHRFTVRPSGDPFQRKVRICPDELARAEYALVIDEGPGLSGSSMASVAKSLAQAGMNREQMAFFPGHAGEPGHIASDEIRGWWRSVPRYFTPLEDVRWGGLSLKEVLLERSAELIPNGGAGKAIEDFGAGLWRKAVWPENEQWPAAAIAFERLKYRCTSWGGERILWKFAGLGAATAPGEQSGTPLFEQMCERAKKGWIPQPLACVQGFIAMPWIEGRRLTRADAADPAIIQHVARYVADAAGPSMPENEAKTSLARLGEMLYCNTRAGVGEELAARAKYCAAAIQDLAACEISPECFRNYGDGHLAPHEWIIDCKGKLFKTDWWGHDSDHTMVGRQSVAWDIAAVIVEWQLDKAAATMLIEALEITGVKIHRPFLFFHRLAYAAFRMGLTFLCANAVHGSASPGEQVVLWHAHTEYREELRRLLKNPRSDVQAVEKPVN